MLIAVYVHELWLFVEEGIRLLQVHMIFSKSICKCISIFVLTEIYLAFNYLSGLWCFGLLVGCTWLVVLCLQAPYRCSCWAVWGCWRWSPVAIKGRPSCCPATAPETPGPLWEAARDSTDGAAQSAERRPARQTSSPVSVCVWVGGGSVWSENVWYCVFLFKTFCANKCSLI